MARDVRWQESVYLMTPQGEHWLYQSTSQPVSYSARRTYETRWNGAVLGPSGLGSPVRRDSEYLHSSVPMFSDGTPGHLGEGWYDSARTVLYRNGVQIAESDTAGYVWAEVPMEASDYRLSADVWRAMSDVSTRVSAAWTFESGYLGQPESTVPIITVRFSPPLDDSNTAPAGRRFTIPVQVEGSAFGHRPPTAVAAPTR